MRYPQLLLEHQLCFRLYAATRALTQAYQPLLAPLGLTYPQYLVMLVLWEKDGLSVREIGERLYLDSGTLSPLLKRLEAMGLLQRVRSARDERVVEIRLTEKGLRLQEGAASIPEKLFCSTGLDVEAIRSLAASLDRLLATSRGGHHASDSSVRLTRD